MQATRIANSDFQDFDTHLQIASWCALGVPFCHSQVQLSLGGLRLLLWCCCVCGPQQQHWSCTSQCQAWPGRWMREAGNCGKLTPRLHCEQAQFQMTSSNLTLYVGALAHEFYVFWVEGLLIGSGFLQASASHVLLPPTAPHPTSGWAALACLVLLLLWLPAAALDWHIPMPRLCLEDG